MMQRRFGVSLSAGYACIGRGVMTRIRRGPWWTRPFLALGRLRNILVADVGTDVPFVIENFPYRDPGGRETVTFVRQYALSPRPARFDATMVFDPGRGIVVDYLGTHQHLAVDLELEVDQEGAVRIIQEIDAGRGRCIHRRTVRLVQHQPVGQTSSLTEIHILQTVTIHVSYGYTVKTTKLRADSRVDPRLPVWYAVEQLFSITSVFPQYRRRTFNEPFVTVLAIYNLFKILHTNRQQPPQRSLTSLPTAVPDASLLDGASAIATRGLIERRSCRSVFGRLYPDDLKLGHHIRRVLERFTQRS